MAGPGWGRVRCGVRQREAAHRVAAEAREAAAAAARAAGAAGGAEGAPAFPIGGEGGLGPGAQERVLELLFRDPALVARGLRPERAYCERVLKALAKEAAADGEELCEELVACLASHPPEAAAPGGGGAGGELPPAGWCFKTYSYNGDGADLAAGELTLALSLNLFEGSTGCHAWEAGFFLAEFVLSKRGLFRGRRCLELGSGPGTVGVALVRAGAAQVSLTDGDADTVENACRNMGLNGAGGGDVGVSCEELRWEAPGRVEADVVLGADLLYDPGVIPDLVRLISHARDPAGAPAEALIATAVRNEATLAKFLAAAGAAGLEVEDLSEEARGGDVKFDHHLTLSRDAVRLHRLVLKE